MVKCFYKLFLALVVAIAMSLGFIACSTYPPVEEYVLAHAALQAAKESEAAFYANIHQSKSEQFYITAVKEFKNKIFS